jgi:hypothetical protein
MPAPANNDSDGRLPPEVRAVPVHPTDETHPLRLCVLVRATPDPVVGSFFELRHLPDARVYLGCICDAGGHVLEQVEVWVQTPEGFVQGLAAHREITTNSILDERWAGYCQALRSCAPEDFIETGWEKRHPPPILLNPASTSCTTPRAPDSGGAWELCRDDLVLEAAGLPAYRSSLVRCLYDRQAGKDSRFVPVTWQAPENESTLEPTSALGCGEGNVPFNLHGGLMLVNRFHPLGYEDYADLLSGKPWRGLKHGSAALPLSEAYRDLTDPDLSRRFGSMLFLGATGAAGRIVEALHLKLRLLADAFRAVRLCVAANQLPFLNLSPESFRVRLDDPGTGLPLYWTARCTIVKPTQAISLAVKTTENRFFVRGGQTGKSIYLPEGQFGGGQGLGTVRMREVVADRRDFLCIEGTLVLQEPVQCSPRDILWIRLPLGGAIVDLYGHVDSDSLAASEVCFRSMPQRFSGAAIGALRSGSVVEFPRCHYEIIPLLSSPCDLCSLGVLAIRTLLVNDKACLPAALDDLLGLAGQVAVEHKFDLPLPARIAVIFDRKAGWLSSLGPHRLLAEELSPSQAINKVPAELWYEVLATLVGLFPGRGSDSECKDLGDAPDVALETVFDRAITELDQLILKTRSLLMVDWAFNREVRSVIEEFRNR